MARAFRLWATSSCKINHFGEKPISGGRPAKDNRMRRRRAVRRGSPEQAIES